MIHSTDEGAQAEQYTLAWAGNEPKTLEAHLGMGITITLYLVHDIVQKGALG